MTSNYYKEKIKLFEAQEKFNEHIMPINRNNVAALDENFKPLPKDIFFVAYSALVRGFLKFITPHYNRVAYNLRIEGRKNLKGLKKGIAISNHVLTTDNLFPRQALKKKLYVAGGDFNNKKGFAGFTLKAGGFIPHGNSLSTQKIFSKALGEILSKNNFVLFYPEQALWPEYEKPRPLNRGAFFFAVKNNVPVVPFFICFRNKSTRYRPSNKTKVTLKILEPIYANNNLEERERIEDMRIRAQESYKKAYEDFYQKPLVYEQDTCE